MKLCSLKLKNFKQYKDFSIEFNEGLTGFIGNNSNENSIIFDSIFFALYGDLENKHSYIDCLNSDDKLVISVELIFEISQGQYKSIREFGGKKISEKAYLYDSSESLQSSGYQEVDKNIRNLISVAKTTFFHTSFILQKELVNLSQSNNEVRKNTIKELLGLNSINDIEIKTRENLIKLQEDLKSFSKPVLKDDEEKNILKKIAIIELELKGKNDLIEKKILEYKNISKDYDEIYDQVIEFKQQKDDFPLMQKELLLIEQQIQNNINQIKEVSNELDNLKNKQKTYKEKSAILETFAQIEISLREQELYKENFLKQESILKEQTRLRIEFKKVREEIHKLNVDIIEKSTYEKDLENLTKQIEVVKKSIKQLERDEEECGNKIAKFNSLINQHEGQLKKLHELGKKSNQHNPLLNEYDNVLSILSNEIDEVYSLKIKELKEEHSNILQKKYKTIEYKEELNKIKNEKSFLLKSLDNKIKRLKTLQVVLKDIETVGRENNENLSKIKDIKYDKVLLHSLQEQYKAMRIEYENVLSLGEQIKNILIHKKDLDFLQDSMVEYTEKKLTILHLIKLNKHNEIPSCDIENLYSNIGLKKEEIESIISQDKKEYESESENLKLLKEKIETDRNNKSKIKIIQDDIDDYEKIKINLLDFKTKINSKIVPRISQVASLLYCHLTKGKYQQLELTNDFDFNIYYNNKVLQNRLLDENERCLVGLVLRIAISKILCELSGVKWFGFLAFNEVLVGLNESKRNQIIDAFLYIKEEFGQIFISSNDITIKKSLEYFVEIK